MTKQASKTPAAKSTAKAKPGPKAKAGAPVAPPPAVYPPETTTGEADVTPNTAPQQNDEAPTAKEDQPQRADEEPRIVGREFDNDAVEGGKAVRSVTLTLEGGRKVKGSTPRTDDLAADQAAAEFQALAGFKR